MRKKFLSKISLCEGYLTLETTISLTAFFFFMMFVMNMGQVYRAQIYVTHAMLQTGKALAFASYDYKTFSVSESIIDNLAEAFGIDAGNDSELYNYWRNKRYTDAVKKTFRYCTGGKPEETDRILKEYGLKDGADTIELEAKLSGSDLDISAKYQIELPFAFFGIEHITMRQQVKCGVWS